MAEEFAGEKTEPATPRKREDARRKGQVAKSQDLTTAILLLTSFCLLFAMAETLVEDLGSLFRSLFSEVGGARLTFDNVAYYGAAGLGSLIVLMAPFVGGLFVLAFLVSIVQVGWMVSSESVTPDIGKLNPIKGFQRIFSIRGLMRLAFGILKLVVVGAVLYIAYRQLFDSDSDKNLLIMLSVDLPQAIVIANAALFRTGGMACIALLVLGLLDFSFQRWKHEQDLKMTKQELREEQKRMEGDPKVKERRRRISQQLALQRMMHDVPKADVVITNPTHYACAISYEDKEMRAPRLLAKGVDHLALRIRGIAIENGVPVVEEPPLARMIYSTTEVGDEVPPELYNQVARVLAYVYRLGKNRRPAGVGQE